MLRESLAFLRKGFLVESTYRITFASNIFAITVNLLIYYFINKLFGDAITGHLQKFGVNYISYVLLSMAVTTYIGAGLGSFSEQIRREQVEGTLETLLTTPIKLNVLLFSLGLWNLTFAILDTAIYIGLGAWFFGVNFSNINILSSLTILFLIITSFSGLGIMSASFILILKRGSPLSWLIGNLEGLLGGAYFPVSVLPAWMQLAAGFFPITYAIRASQLAVYQGYSIFQLKNEIAFLLLFSIVLLPLSLRVFTFALKKAKIKGNLTQF